MQHSIRSLMPLFGVAAIATLSACNNEVTEVNETQVVGMQVLDKGEKMPKCNADSEGDMVYALDSAGAYVCVNKKWASLNGKDGADGKDGKDGADGKDGRDGIDGEDGADGEDGKDGSDGKNGSDAEALFIDESSYNAETNTLTDLRDGKTYKTTTIGEQVWMAENLNYLYYFKATEDSIVVPDYCYNDTASYCDKYGRLYQWSAAMDSAAVFSDGGKGCGQFADCESKAPVRGVCPKGWHLPSVEEFVKLLDAVGGNLIAGDTLKSTSGWEEDEHGIAGNGTDDYGFTALPGGFRETGSEYDALGRHAIFWTSSLGEQDGYLVIEIDFWAGSNDVIQVHSYKWRSNSVRCLMD